MLNVRKLSVGEIIEYIPRGTKYVYLGRFLIASTDAPIAVFGYRDLCSGKVYFRVADLFTDFQLAASSLDYDLPELLREFSCQVKLDREEGWLEALVHMENKEVTI